MNSIIMPVILSVPNPSLAARLVGHILSIICPKIPQRPGIARLPLVGDLVGEADAYFVIFLVGLTPPTLLRAPAVTADYVYLRVG
jgi:xanthosine utilization system XapX-like protein